MKNSQKGFVVPLLIAIIAVLVIGGGVYIYENKKAETPVSTNVIDQTNDQAQTPISQNTQDTAPVVKTTPNITWKTYSNPEHQFSIQYPSNWTVDTGVAIVKFHPSNQIQKPGTDAPIDQLIVTNEPGCNSEGWNTGFGGASYKHICVSSLSLGIEMVALSEDSKVIENRIANSFIKIDSTGQPVITSILPTSGPMGTLVEIHGTNLSGFEGDLIVTFKRSDGKTVALNSITPYYSGHAGDPVNTTVIKVRVEPPCQRGQTVYGSYSGIPAVCDYFEFSPGIYKIYVDAWGKKSNEVQFTVTQSDISELNTFTHVDSGITFKYPKDWKFDATKNYFTTSDYQEGKSGARIEFEYGLSGDSWMRTVAAMYGSKSINTLISINGKSVYQTLYPSDPHLIGLSMPFANESAFVSLFLRYEAPGRFEASYKESYEPVLQQMVDNMTLPLTLSDVWHTYINQIYNFSFNHPPLTSVISDGTYFKNSVTSYNAGVRYGFHQSLFVFTKPADQSLRTWYDNTFSGMTPARGPIEKTINGYSAIDVTFSDLDTAGRHIMVGKGEVVIDFLFSNATVDSPLTVDQQKLLDSFLFH